MSDPRSNRFSWLHLTDLHQGMGGQQPLWPEVREAFFDDLTKLCDPNRCGPWTTVLFTGDLTQRGTESEFARLDDVLGELWDHFATLGCKPVLLAVPGNHDLVRPNRLNPTHRMLANWLANTDAHADLWAEESEYRKAIEDMFAPYTAWWAKRSAAIPSEWNFVRGRLPGEWSVQIPVGERKVGIVGLNSAYVQLTGDDFMGKLHLDVQQFHAACAGDGPRWAKANGVSLLLSHHGPDWLSPAAREQLRSGIDVPPRFLAHLHGHMHTGQTQLTAEGGSAARRRWQGSSLFGLEWFGDKVERLHGYSASWLEFSEAGGADAKLRSWPRKAVKLSAGFWKLGPDPEMDLEDDGGMRSESIAVRRIAPAPGSGPASGPKPNTREADAYTVATEHLSTIEAYKNLHDEFHKIELLCLRPLLYVPTAQQLRAALRDLKSSSAELADQIASQGARIDKALGTMIGMEVQRAVDHVTEINVALRGSTDPEFEQAQVGAAIEELQEILGQYPSKLEEQLANASKRLRDDHRLDGVAPLEQLRRELEGRVDEHTWLQKIDGELRGSKTSVRHWSNVKFMIAQIRPVSNDLREAWPDIEADTRQVDALLQAIPQARAEITKAFESYSQTIAGVFRNVDAELKRLLGQLVKSARGKQPEIAK